MRKSTPSYHQKKMFPVKQPPQDKIPHFQRGDNVKKEEPSEVVCYGCGTPGVIKPKCSSCKGKDKRNHGTFSSVILQSASCPSKQLATLKVTINGVMGTACADTAATHSIAGETLYHILKKQGTTFTTGSLTVSLADGSKIEREVNTTRVKIRLGGRTLPLNLVAIPGAKNNNTLLDMDFIESSGIVLNVKRKTWFFDALPKRQLHFVEQIQESCDAVKSNAFQTAAPLTVKETEHPDPSRAEEVNHLTSIQQLKLKDHPDQLREDEDLDLYEPNLILHTFCGTSKSAYVACIFLRPEKDGKVTCQLVQARSRVAPLRDYPYQRWDYLQRIYSQEDAQEKLLNKQWYEGPLWLRNSRKKWSDFELSPDENIIYAEMKIVMVSSLNKENDEFYNDISSYKRVVRVTGWIYRFHENTKTCNKKTGELSEEELKKAELKILKVQEDSFQGEKMQHLKSLSTAKDADGIFRIKTKIIMRKDNENFKVPIVLPSDPHVVKSLILSKHQDLGHPGVQSLMGALRGNYWIVKSRRTIKKIPKPA
ncbi:integrase catalytic domain-containing protein [Nephila pilipes]|uniref:Integrase catalytic domain-containing protein n=1 Tax=Nephila pilipes TaxID=299642 RepID=A0A8X6PB89_NEPPI|nr:integrase catalytic domain-containing protein [Nephila pilipes]